MDATGNLLSANRYLPYGELRTDTILTEISEIDKGYTGQRNYPGFRLMDYNARFYNPYLKHFAQPDPIIPCEGINGCNPNDDIAIKDIVKGFYGDLPENSEVDNFDYSLLAKGGAKLRLDGHDLSKNYSGNNNDDMARTLIQQYVIALTQITSVNTNEIQVSAVEFASIIGADI